MQVLLIVLAIVALLVFGLSFLPLRLKIAGSVASSADCRIELKIGHLIKIRLYEIKDKNLRETAKGMIKSQADKKKAKTKVKAEKLPPLAKEDIKILLPECLSRLRVEKLDLKASLAGNPYYAGLACGALWIVFGAGFGWLSHQVKRFTAHPRLDFGVDLTKPWSLNGEIVLMIRLRNLPRLGFKVLGMIIKNRKKQKTAAQPQAVAA